MESVDDVGDRGSVRESIPVTVLASPVPESLHSVHDQWKPARCGSEFPDARRRRPPTRRPASIHCLSSSRSFCIFRRQVDLDQLAPSRENSTVCAGDRTLAVEIVDRVTP